MREELSSFSQRVITWLAPVWLLFVLSTFFVIRILGSRLVQRISAAFGIKFGQ